MSSTGAALGMPRTQAVRRVLQTVRDERAAADFLFLENWESERPNDLAATLRVSQIRRANPDLAAEIHAELASAVSR